MSRQSLGTETFEFHVRKRVPVTSDQNMAVSGYTTVPDGKEVVEFEVLVDREAIVRWAADKVRNSPKGVSRIAGGAVVVKVKSRKRMS